MFWRVFGPIFMLIYVTGLQVKVKVKVKSITKIV